MRRILFYVNTGTNRRQYEEMVDKVQTQYRERIYPVLQARINTGHPDLEYAEWEWVEARMGSATFMFWIAAPWDTSSQEDAVLDAMLTQHLELSIVPLIYWDDVTMEWASHDCTYDINVCSKCDDEDWNWATATTRVANDTLAIVLPTNL